jgi:hypothetical protein
MCRLDCYDAYQCWPNYFSFKVNGRPAFTIDAPKAGHKRRDLPHRISANLKPGVNVFEVTTKDQNVQNFALAVLRTRPQLPKDMCKHVRCIGVEECKQKVMDLMFASSLDGCIEDFQCAASDRARLICPISLARIRTPVRGKKCRHMQCFDLEAYLVSNQKMSAINKRWTCPICDAPVKPPSDLFIDTWFVQILAETGRYDEEVAFDSTGGYRVSAVADPDDLSEDELPVVAQAPTGSAKPQDDDVCSDAEMLGEQQGKADGSDVEAVGVEDDDAVDLASGDDNDAVEANAGDKEDSNQDDDRPAADGEPMGSPSASSPANLGSASPDPGCSASPDPGSDGEDEDLCQTDPYGGGEPAQKDEDEVDEDFVATLRASPPDVEEGAKSEESGTSKRMRMSMIATPAPLASPAIGSPVEASDHEDDPLGLDADARTKKTRELGKCTSNPDAAADGGSQKHDRATTPSS